MLEAQCLSCTIVSEMPVIEDPEGVLTVRCVYCGAEQTILFDTPQHTEYAKDTPSEGATK